MPTFECRLMCAANSAYGIDGETGKFTPPQPYYDAVGYKLLPLPPQPVWGTGPLGEKFINAALIGTNSDGVIVAFRGTISPALTDESVLDWIQNTFAEPKQVTGLPGEVHTGFSDAVHSIWTKLRDAIQAQQSAYPLADGSRPPVYFTGHSKGGALASIAAMILNGDTTGLRPKSICTFASPRPGNTVFRDAYNLAFSQQSYENYLDIVPFLPPDAKAISFLKHVPLLGDLVQQAHAWDYATVGNRLYIGKNGTVVPASTVSDSSRLFEIAVKLFMGNIGAVVAAHCPDCASAADNCAGGYMKAACQGDVCGT